MDGLSAQQQAASAVAACTAQLLQQQLEQASISMLNAAEGPHCTHQEISTAQLQTQLAQAHNELTEYKGYLAEVGKDVYLWLILCLNCGVHAICWLYTVLQRQDGGPGHTTVVLQAPLQCC